MCPACLASVALIVAGTGSAGGLGAFLIKKLRSSGNPPTPKSTHAKATT